ncbi:MAG: hypothetical protein PVG07_00710 [Acidobacteriota bacterium]|jgi:hypothetical protein
MSKQTWRILGTAFAVTLVIGGSGWLGGGEVGAAMEKMSAEEAPTLGLTVGDSTNYHVTRTRSNGTKSISTATRSVESAETIEGREYKKVVWTVSAQPDLEPQTIYHRVAADGVYVRRLMGKEWVEYLFTPLPLSVGRTWTVDTPSEKATYVVTRKEDVAVAGGTVPDTFRVEYSGTLDGQPFSGFTNCTANDLDMVRMSRTAFGETVVMETVLSP